jgi:hypothetical protein
MMDDLRRADIDAWCEFFGGSRALNGTKGVCDSRAREATQVG